MVVDSTRSNDRKQPAILVLEDGSHFEGIAAGAPGKTIGEAVFNTSMSGYQEILTDPSYRGQLLTFTMPHIGNYGVSGADRESMAIQASGLIVRSISRMASNYRSEISFIKWLEDNGTVAISEVDTRALTRHIRDKGVMMGAIVHGAGAADVAAIVAELRDYPDYGNEDMIARVACEQPMSVVVSQDALCETQLATGLRAAEVRLVALGSEPVATERPHVVVVDFGVKQSILRCLDRSGFRMTLVPASYGAEQIAALKPDGVLYSNGPGDPAVLDHHLASIRQTSMSHPTLGICLGHQLLARAHGASTFKLPFGHRGPNQPVMNLARKTVCMTSQNHGYAVDPTSFSQDVVITHVNLNDQTIEGFRHRTLPIFAVQYHPEAGPGPHDADDCFDDFAAAVRANL
ncbi:MAG: glutamine-hydrolyzing carbamoyl-phosphate synthase small subunit [Bradymonadaceae bacterium]|nr:glutamine-hydrolyzing carbamoyl-phosphate synthase small subunit [Lujinxingiaceae bacterium]